MKQLTIFTPSYNRVHLLPRLYESLIKQTCKEFIWMIIDDGSSDGTKELVENWINKSNIEIIYLYKKNGGLHTAYNKAIENITTELAMCIDSDDYVPNDCVQKVLSFWNRNGSPKYAGIVGLDYYENGNVIGDFLPNQKEINLIDLLIGKYHIKNGDRTNVVRTKLYKEVAPMKVFDGEKNFNPHFMHLKISENYDFLVINECLRYVDYQDTGMSANIIKQYRNSPNSFLETRLLYLSFNNASLKFKIKNTIHLISSAIFCKKINYAFKKTNYKILFIILFGFGFLLNLYIRIKAND